MAKKEVKFTERNGEKFVAKKASWVKKVKTVFWLFSIIWIGSAAWAPLYVKDTFSEPIKKSMVVSVFFDLQQGIADQYGKLMDGIKNSVNIEKPIKSAIAKIKSAEKPVAKAKKTANDAKKLSSFAGKFGIKTSGIEKAVDNVANNANVLDKQLDKIEKELTKTTQTEINVAIDEAARKQVDKVTGGMSAALLTKYNLKSMSPWRPSTWTVSNKIYADIERASASTVQIIMNTVDKYFGYVAWALVAIAWAIALFMWFYVFKKVKAITSPFVVCPNCGHAFSDKRTAVNLLKILKPWTWL